MVVGEQVTQGNKNGNTMMVAGAGVAALIAIILVIIIVAVIISRKWVEFFAVVVAV